MGFRTHFFRATTRLARWGTLLVPNVVVCSLSPSRVHSCLLSDRRGTVSLKFFDTQVLFVSTEEFVLSRLRSNGHTFLLSSFLSRIGRIKDPAVIRRKTPFILFCTVQLRTLHRLLFGHCAVLGTPWSSGMLSSLGRTRLATTAPSANTPQLLIQIKRDQNPVLDEI